MNGGILPCFFGHLHAFNPAPFQSGLIEAVIPD